MDSPPSNPRTSQPTVVHYLKWMRLQDGGVVRAVLDLAELLAQSGTRVVLLTCDDRDVPSHWPRSAADQPLPATHLPVCIPIPLNDPLATLQGRNPNDSDRDTPTQHLSRATLRKIGAFLGSVQSPVLHLHGPWAISNAQLARLCRSHAVPYVLSPHGMLDDWCMQIGRLRKRIHLTILGRAMFRGARSLHFTAQAERDQSLRTIQQRPSPTLDQSAVIPLPIDLTPFLSSESDETSAQRGRSDHPILSPDDALRVVFLSRLHEKKGVERLLQALSLAKAEGANCRAVIAGPSHTPEYLASLQTLATQLGIASIVSFPGMVQGNAKVALYRSAHVFVLPSSQENFGIVIVEAMACGVPVITTRGVDIWPELQHSGGAIICPSDPAPQVRELANALVSLERNPDRRATMSAAASEWARESLHTPTIIARFQEMYSIAATQK